MPEQEQVAGILSSTHSEVAGVTVDGRLCGYVDRASLQSGRCRDFVIPFTADQVVPEHSSLTDVIEVLTRRDRCFVTAGGAVSGYAGRSDMQKPLMRMWLFGIVTLIEMEFVERIRAEWPEDGWIGLVSAARLEQARELQGNRARMNQPCELLDCLQLADKAQILLQDERQLRDFGFELRARRNGLSANCSLSATTSPTPRTSCAMTGRRS